MSKNGAALVCLPVALVLLIACSAVPVPTQPEATASPSQPALAPVRPNIVFILTDDLDADSIKYMPKLKSLVVYQGTTFSNFFLNVALCCPSRTTILRGQYAHNSQVITNAPPDGGFARVYELGLEKSMVGLWLQAAGYKTMLAGKYLNGYPTPRNLLYIPPGWDEWSSAVRGNAYGEFNYTLNENGQMVRYDSKPEDYGTDVYARKVVDFMRRTAKKGQPFFVYYSVYAPHGPSTPAPRHERMFANATAPRTPNFNEEDVSDKPAYIRNRPKLSDRETRRIDEAYRKRLQSLQAVDDAIESMVHTLRAAGQLDNTYIFFASDNGFHLGNHRLSQGKQAPYEEDIRVPMFVRGPGVPAGQTLEHLVGNVDLAPTWAELGGAGNPDFVDGRSLVSLLKSHTAPATQWRTAYLIQHGQRSGRKVRSLQRRVPAPTPGVDGTREPPDRQDLQGGQGARAITPYVGIRTKNHTYVEYVTGEKELYDLKNDPYQLQNIAEKESADVLKSLATHLNALKKCAGASCRKLD